MAAVILRRSVATAALAALATALVPTAVSWAAPSTFAASGITTDPAPDSNNVVQANRPTVIAKFNDTPASGSVTLTQQGGDGSNLCGTPVIDSSKNTVSCTATTDLDTTKKYDAVGNATDSAGNKAKTDTLTFTVDYPVLDGPNSAPIPGGSLTGGGEDIVAAFNEEVTGNSKSWSAPDAAFKLYEVNADGSRGVQLPGTITFQSPTPILGGDGTVTFNPLPNLSQGRYEAVLLVHGVDGNGKDNPRAVGRADYPVFINNTAPFNLNIPVPQYNGKPYANTANNTAFPFSGNAAPGLTVTVDVQDPMDPNPLSNDYSDTTVVEPCASAPSCPWTVPLDISGFTDQQSNVNWTASIQDVNGQPSSNPPTSDAASQNATFNVDYSAPPAVSVNPAPTINQSTTTHQATVLVNATDTAPDVQSYLVTITDPEGNKLAPTIPAQGTSLPSTPIDVTTLDDGTLNITIQAVDNHGNVSKAQSSPYQVTKNVGLVPNLGTSTLTASGDDKPFSEINNQSVQSPTKVTVAFTQTIKQQWKNSANPSSSPQNSSLCIASQNGNCLVQAPATVNSDNRSLSMPIKDKLGDGSYTVLAHTFSAGNCPDASIVNPNPSCESFDGIVTDPATGQPFRFTVDNTKPTLSIDQFSHPVTKTNDKTFTISGTVSKTATNLQIIISSSGRPAVHLLNQATITQRTNPSDTLADWKAGPLDLSSLADGLLTIKAKATGGNGLTASRTVHAKMQAHLSQIIEHASHRRVTAGHAVKISGRLLDENGNAITGENVTIRPRFASGHFGKAHTTATTVGGFFSTKFHPKHSATYVATYLGSPTHDGARSSTAHVGVRFHVTLSSPAGASPSTPVTLTGKVGPNHKGAIVTIYRHTSSGNVAVGKARLDKHSTFSAKVVLPAGTDKVFASVTKTKGNLAGRSRTLTLHVH